MSGRRLPRAALLTAALSLATGCAQTEREAPARPATAPALAAQIAAVRAGTSDSIRTAEPVEGEAWQALTGLRGLRELVVEAGSADDAAAAVLGALPDLERLVLRGSPVGDEGLAALGRLERLRDLNLPHAAATARGVGLLADGPAGKSLRSLRLGGPHLAGVEVAAAVARIGGLRSVHLVDVPIGDEGLAALARLSGLWNLYLDGAGVSDAAWGGYCERHPDVHVHVDQAHHDRDPRQPH